MYSCTWKHFFFFSLPYRHLFLDLLLRIQLVTPWLMIKQRGWQKTQKLLQNYLSIYLWTGPLPHTSSIMVWKKTIQEEVLEKIISVSFSLNIDEATSKMYKRILGVKRWVCRGIIWSPFLWTRAVIFALRSLQRPQMVSRHERWVWV